MEQPRRPAREGRLRPRGALPDEGGLRRLPTVNAILNGTAATLLLAGFFLIRSGSAPGPPARDDPRVRLLGPLLVSYLVYHAPVGSVRFQGTGAVRTLYLSILLTHTVLAAAVPFLAVGRSSSRAGERFGEPPPARRASPSPSGSTSRHRCRHLPHALPHGLLTPCPPGRAPAATGSAGRNARGLAAASRRSRPVSTPSANQSTRILSFTPWIPAVVVVHAERKRPICLDAAEDPGSPKARDRGRERRRRPGRPPARCAAPVEPRLRRRGLARGREERRHLHARVVDHLHRVGQERLRARRGEQAHVHLGPGLLRMGGVHRVAVRAEAGHRQRCRRGGASATA
ncbi:MAG: DUF420 domain-containing protein [Holophagales bacterium]|nr:DUF420 domain-containing protein [Holophagales bacterium]